MYNLILLIILTALIALQFDITMKFYKYLYFILLIVITLTMGLRFNVGLDYMTYYYTFHDSYDWFTYEPIYAILQYLFKVIFNNFTIFTTFIAIVTMAFINAAIALTNNDYKLRLISLLLFTSLFFFVFMNLMRAGLSASIVFYAFTFRNKYHKVTTKKKNIIIFLLLIIAGLLHYSVFIVLPIIFISEKITLNKFRYLLLFILTMIFVQTDLVRILMSKIILLVPRYSGYIDLPGIFPIKPSSISIVILFEFLLIMILKFNKRRTVSNDNIFENVSSAGLVLKELSLGTFLINRISLFLNLFILGLIPELFSDSSVNRKRFVLVVVSILVLGSFVGNAYRNTDATNLKYESVFTTEFSR